MYAKCAVRPSHFHLSLVCFLALSFNPTAANAWSWVPWGIEHGGAMPPNSFIGGSETVLNSGGRVRQLYVCQIEDGLKGIHPGKGVEGDFKVGIYSKEIKNDFYHGLSRIHLEERR